MDLANILSSVFSSNDYSLNNTVHKTDQATTGQLTPEKILQGLLDRLSTQEERTTTTGTIQRPTQAMNILDEADMQKYDSALRRLNDMGFTDKKNNLEMIRLANGDINLAIEYLVGSANGPE